MFFNLDSSGLFSFVQELNDVNSLLTNVEILTLSKFRAFADDNLSGTENVKFLFHMVGNIAGKGENAGYQHFLLFSQYFKKLFFPTGASKVVIAR